MTTTIGLRKLKALLMNSLKQYHPDLKDRPTETSNLYPPHTQKGYSGRLLLQLGILSLRQVQRKLATRRAALLWGPWDIYRTIKNSRGGFGPERRRKFQVFPQHAKRTLIELCAGVRP